MSVAAMPRDNVSTVLRPAKLKNTEPLARLLIATIRSCRSMNAVYEVYPQLQQMLLELRCCAGVVVPTTADEATHDEIPDAQKRCHLLAAVLCASFGRRMKQIAAALSTRTTYNHGFSTLDVQPKFSPLSSGGYASTALHAQNYALELIDALKAMETPTKGSESLILYYARGELHDLITMLRTRAEEELHRLVNHQQSLWTVEEALHAIDVVSHLAGYAISAHANRSCTSTMEPTRVRVPLCDPLSRQLIRYPGRGLHCAHYEFFDLSSFLQAVLSRGTSRGHGRLQLLGNSNEASSSTTAGLACPLCRTFIPVEELRLDVRAQTAITTAAPSADDCLEYDVAEEGNCRVMAGKRGRSNDSAHEDDETSPVVDATTRRRRRVEIGGRVMFVDE